MNSYLFTIFRMFRYLTVIKHVFMKQLFDTTFWAIRTYLKTMFEKLKNQEIRISVQFSRHYTRADVFQTANTHRVSHCTQRTGQNVVERYSIYIPYNESLRRLSKTRGFGVPIWPLFLWWFPISLYYNYTLYCKC